MVCWLCDVWFVSDGSIAQSHVSEGELILPRIGGRHGELDAPHADAHQGAELQQPEADGAARRVSELRVRQTDAGKAQSST